MKGQCWLVKLFRDHCPQNVEMQPELRTVDIMVEVGHEVERLQSALPTNGVPEEFLQLSISIEVRLVKPVLSSIHYQVEGLEVRLTIVCLAIIREITWCYLATFLRGSSGHTHPDLAEL